MLEHEPHWRAMLRMAAYAAIDTPKPKQFAHSQQSHLHPRTRGERPSTEKQPLAGPCLNTNPTGGPCSSMAAYAAIDTP